MKNRLNRSLVGLYFHRFEKEHSRKGRVLSEVGPGHYLIEMLSFNNNTPYIMTVVSCAVMAEEFPIDEGSWVFHSSMKEMDEWWAHMNRDDSDTENRGKVVSLRPTKTEE